MIDKIRIAIWNANGLAKHGLEIKTFLSNQKIDVMLVSEAHFTNKTYFKIPEYSVYTTPRPDGMAYGGSAIIIRNKIRHHELEKTSLPFLQATTISINEWIGKLTLSAVYCPPRYTIDKDQFTDYFNSLGTRFIAGGDYNAKHPQWGSRLTTPKGRQLWKAMSENNLYHLSTGQPTYWPSDREKIPDLLDFCVIKGISQNNLNIESCFDLSSDHSPIIATLSSKVLTRTIPLKLHNNRTNWEKYRQKIQQQITPDIKLKTTNDIDSAITMFQQVITQSAMESTPTTKARTNMQIEVCSSSVRELIKKKRDLRRRWQQTRFPGDKTALNNAAKMLKQKLLEEKNESIQKYLRELDPSEASDYSLWKATKKLKQLQHRVPPIKTESGSWARSNQEIANTFGKHLNKVFTPYAPLVSLEEEDFIHQYMSNNAIEELPEIKFKVTEIKQIVKELNIKKAAGRNKITGKMLKELPPIAIKILTFIFNAVLRLKYYPQAWKIAKIILVLKQGKPESEVTSYRPISLLPIESKVLEKLLLTKIKPILEQNQIIPSHQFGFRKQHSTIEQVHRVVNHIKTNIEDKKYCSAAFLDVTQAFDKVWHPGLLFKIKKHIPLFLELLKSYLSERYFTVTHEEAESPLHPIRAGVPQGSALGPLLYTLYTSDLPTSNNITLATFADDTAIMASDVNPIIASKKLQSYLNKLQTWLNIWRIKVNSSKSVHITFTTKSKNCAAISLNNCVLPHKEEVRYLGIHLDRKLNWRKHIWTKRKQLGLKFTKMYWLIGRKSQLSLDSKVLLYKSILKPVWTYGIELWGAASVSNIDIIQRFQSKVIRSIADAPYYVPNEVLHRDLQINTIKDEIMKSSARYQLRLSNHPNRLATEIMNQQHYRRLKRADPLDLPHRFD